MRAVQSVRIQMFEWNHDVPFRAITVRDDDNIWRTFHDNEMEQKCDVPASIHDAGTKWWPCMGKGLKMQNNPTN